MKPSFLQLLLLRKKMAPTKAREQDAFPCPSPGFNPGPREQTTGKTCRCISSVHLCHGQRPPPPHPPGRNPEIAISQTHQLTTKELQRGTGVLLRVTVLIGRALGEGSCALCSMSSLPRRTSHPAQIPRWPCHTSPLRTSLQEPQS
jgi:hypothetical protein